jgi:NADPH:quinone reductase-like Zn-dependent oxidoreductase
MELRDVPEPRPAPGEVRVRVAAAGLNPVDYKLRQGKLRAVRRFPLPMIAGCELAGTVDAVGPGADRFDVGDRVYAQTDPAILGAFAELVCVRQDLVAPMPGSIAFAEAAGLPLAGVTALQALRDELSVREGTKIFISGGAGGVGTLAVQLARHFGAHVTTTASPRGEALVRRLGADRVIDYTRERIADQPGDYDAALDLVGGTTLKEMFRIVKPGGKVVSVAGIPEPLTARKDLAAPWRMAALFWIISAATRRRARKAKVGYRYLLMHPDGDDLRVLTRLVEEGRLRPVVDSTYPLDRIADAFAALEQGHAKGKIVITMPAAP